MSVNLEQFKPVTYLVFTTNALRNNIGDGTLEYYKKYESPFSSFTKADEPFSADHPEFFYCNEFTVKRFIRIHCLPLVTPGRFPVFVQLFPA